MGTYKYQVRTPEGQTRNGTMSADSVASATATLRQQGAHVLNVSAQSSIGGGGFGALFRQINNSKPGPRQVLEFTTQLAVMLRAGISLRNALEGIADQTAHAGFRVVLEGIRSDVEGGKSFSQALEAHSKLFSPLYINMVKASEMSGSFSEMLDRVAGYIGQQLETRRMVIGSAIYPAVIGIMAISVTVFLLTFVLPQFYSLFEGKEDILPLATVILMGMSRFVIGQWPFIIGGVVGVAVLFWLTLKSETGSFWFDKLKLSTPVLKPMFRSLYVSRSLQTMGELINAGVPMLDTLTITGDVTGNQLYQLMWQRVFNSVKQGRKIAAPLQGEALLPGAVVQMISAGEESGKLGEVLDEVSTYYAKMLKDQIKTVIGLIEPIMIIIMGSVVGFIAMAILLPVFKMSQLVQ